MGRDPVELAKRAKYKPPAMRVRDVGYTQKSNSLSHTKWVCKYHIVFTPKYRRKIIYNQYKESIRDALPVSAIRLVRLSQIHKSSSRELL